MFSVIIPLYNKAKYIQRAIESVLNQTYQNFEIIIVNDGSTDESMEIVSLISLEDKRIKLISQENHGVSSARNMGIANASYDYIAFLDGDDFYHNNFLEVIFNLIQKHDSIEVISSFISVNKEFKEINHIEYFQVLKKDFFKLLIRYHPLLSSSSTVIKKDLIVNNHLKFDINLKFGEDTDFWNQCVEASQQERLIIIKTELACYDLNDSNTSITNSGLRLVQHTFFYKILNSKKKCQMQGESLFKSFYVYMYYLSYYKSIAALRLNDEIKQSFSKLEYRNYFIEFLLTKVLTERNKMYLSKIVIYFRLIYSKSLKSLPIYKLHLVN
ncbi:MAG: glycosyltransferase family 2 protein [Flavobacteriaceae bacterium]|nr:glycosyltransferase family 2 protein [Flavobacteriaceae bacterium]